MKSIYDFNLIEKFYNSYSCNVDKARKEVGHPLTLTEKILYTHMYGKMSGNELRRVLIILILGQTELLCKMLQHKWRYFNL